MKQIKEVNGSKKDGNGVRGHTTLLSEDTEAKFFLEMSDWCHHLISLDKAKGEPPLLGGEAHGNGWTTRVFILQNDKPFHKCMSTPYI